MKGKKITALFMAVSVFLTNGSITFAAEETMPYQNTEIIQNEAVSYGTKEYIDWEYAITNNKVTLTKYKGNEIDVTIPEQIEGKDVVQLEQDVFRNNTTVQSIHIPKTIDFIGHSGDGVISTFDGMCSLKSFTVDEQNQSYFSRDGVLYMYSAVDGFPLVFKYPDAREAETYYIPNDVAYIDGISDCKNLKTLVIPPSVKSIFLLGILNLSEVTIILQQTDPEQIDMEKGFSQLRDCTIIVKNEEMKKAVETALTDTSVNTAVKTESELTAEEKANILTPATALSFSDGSTVKNVTLMPDGKCTHAPKEGSTRLRASWMDVNYTVSPADTTDIVTWNSTNPDVADVYVYNGRSVLIGISDGTCTITGTTESGKQITLNVTVEIPVDKTEIRYNHINNPETKFTLQDDDFSSSILFRIYPYNATYRKNVTWNSSDPEVLDVKANQEMVVDTTYYSHKATLSLKKPGTATITATMQDGSKVITRSVTITVTTKNEAVSNTTAPENNSNTDISGNTTSNNTKNSQKITNVSSSYKKAYKTSFTLKPKAKTSCTYKSSNKKVATVNSKGKVTIKGTGKAIITITAKETSKYKKATKKVIIYSVPAKMKTPVIKAGKKKLTVSWKKDSRSDGYQIQYSTSKNFKKAKTVNCSKKATKTTIKKLKKGKKYYIRIHSYKKIGKKKYYGSYSKVKSIKVK